MSFTPRDNAGALFHQKEKSNEKAPDYSGEALINGVPMKIAGWRKTSAKGVAYLSLSFQAGEGQRKQTRVDREPGDDDDVAF